jgi:hypothetical protein
LFAWLGWLKALGRLVTGHCFSSFSFYCFGVAPMVAQHPWFWFALENFKSEGSWFLKGDCAGFFCRALICIAVNATRI